MIDVIELKGSTIVKILEQSVCNENLDLREGYGGFLQVSGMMCLTFIFLLCQLKGRITVLTKGFIETYPFCEFSYTYF